MGMALSVWLVSSLVLLYC